MKTRLRYALLFIFAATPLVEIGHVKLIPLALAAALFAAHGLIALLTRGRERSLWRDQFSAVLLMASLIVAGMFLLTSLTLVLAPPVTADGHPVMPGWQILIGGVGGIWLGMALAIQTVRAPWRDLRLMRLVVHGIGAVVIAAAIAAGLRA